MGTVRLGLVLVAACYHPQLGAGAPCPDDVCPTGEVCELSSHTCQFPGGGGVDGGGDATDATSTDGNPRSGSGSACYGSGFVTACFAAPPTGTIVLDSPIDTDSSASCAAGFPDLCVVAGAQVKVVNIARATGSRPLVLLGVDLVQVMGTLDVASHVGSDSGAAANAGACGTGTLGNAGCGDGGAGGSFATSGGPGGGGEGDTGGGDPAPVVAIDALSGGCPGQCDNQHDGGGAGGGAVYAISTKQIQVTGAIDASGAGGDAGTVNGAGPGGCGGGAGGLIGFDAPMTTISASALVIANGGGGGGGAGDGAATAGVDPSSSAAAAGGTGGSGIVPANVGGKGGAGATFNGNGGTGSDGGNIKGGGGGGGGGDGAIVVFGTLTNSGTVTPPATPR